MLSWRLTVGALLIAVLIGLCWIDHAVPRRGMVLVPVAFGLVLLATGELLHFFRAGGHTPRVAGTQFAALVTVVCTAMPVLAPSMSRRLPIGAEGWLAFGLFAGLASAFIGTMRSYEPHGDSTRTSGATVQVALSLLAVLYIGGLVSCIILLRTIPPDSQNNDWGMLALISMIVVVKSGDTGAYTVGRRIGRHKMAPTLSPGKTWEGTCGGLVCSCIGAWLMLEIVPETIGWLDGPNSTRGVPNFIAYGLIVGIAGIIGDLAESLLKRDAGVKDSSAWMPGMGGVLDVLDSMLAAAPVAYLFWVAS